MYCVSVLTSNVRRRLQKLSKGVIKIYNHSIATQIFFISNTVHSLYIITSAVSFVRGTNDNINSVLEVSNPTLKYLCIIDHQEKVARSLKVNIGSAKN